MSGVRSGLVWTFPGLGKIFENPGQFIPALRRRLVTSVLGWLARKLNPQATFENYVDPRVLTLHDILHEDQCNVLCGAGIPESFLEASENFTRGRSGNVSKRKIRVGMATRLLADKGVDTFLGAASAITARELPMEFHLAGVHDPGNPGSISMDAVREAEERGEIIFHGALNSAQMPEFLASLDVLCLPTRLREGFPRSLIEAALAGCALIATDQQSIRQIVVPDKTGWLLPGGDRGELCERLEFIAGKPEEVHRAGAEAREFALSLPIADHDIVQAFREVYRAALVR